MNSMRLLAVFLGLATIVAAHTYLSEVIVNGARQGDLTCIRPHISSAPPVYRESPVSDKTVFPNGLLGANMTCGFLPNAGKPANKKCPVKAGDTVGLQWWHARPGDDVLDPTHVGPTMAYMAKSDSGAGNVWFKVYAEGYDAATKTWASNKMINNGGVFSFKIPSDISPGNYLLRGEIIGLHEGFMEHGAQAYVGCAELTVSSSGTANPTGVAFPGAYSLTDPGILVSVYQGEAKNAKYVIPGPAVYVSGSSSTPSAPSSPTPAPATPTTKPSTTGRVKSSTPSAPTPAPTTPTSTPSSPPSTSAMTGTCTTLGNMACVGSTQYQTCSNGRTSSNEWSIAQDCPSGRKCSPAGQFIYCL